MSPQESEQMVMGLHLAQMEEILPMFAYEHLPPHLQAVSKPFGDLAKEIGLGWPCAERVQALRKVLEAKDCAVRAFLIEQKRGE